MGNHQFLLRPAYAKYASGLGISRALHMELSLQPPTRTFSTDS